MRRLLLLAVLLPFLAACDSGTDEVSSVTITRAQVTSLSFDDHLDLGVITCEHLLPDPTAVAELIEEEFAELLSRARGAAPAGAA